MDDGLSKQESTTDTIVPLEAGKDDRRAKAQEYLEQLRRAVVTQGAVYLQMGWLLKQIKDEKLYQYLGTGGYDTFAQFLAGPELSIHPTTAYALIAIYNRYIEQFQFKESQLQGVPWYKLQLLSSIEPKDKDDAEEWLEKARTLGPVDFRHEVNEFKGNKGHDHPIPYPHIYRCKDCGMWRIEIDPKYTCHCVEPA